MMDKFKNLDPQTRRTASLAATLLVVIIASLVVLYVMSGSSDSTATQRTPQVQEVESVKFNRRALEYVRNQTNRDRPSLGGRPGRDNPFSRYE